MKKTLPVLIFLISLLSIQLSGQRHADPWEVYRGKYCYSISPAEYIGDTVKIWAEGGTYSGFCNGKSEKFAWASDSLKKLCDCNYRPKEGELGIIRFASPDSEDRIGIENILYLAEFNGHLVTIGCGSIIEKDSLSISEQDRKLQRRDSVENAIYAKGCAFKTAYFQGSPYAAGTFPIDRKAENLCCELQAKDVDTLLLLKAFYDNHGLGESNYEAVIWTENGRSYYRIFQNINNRLIQSANLDIDFRKAIDFFTQHQSSILNSEPQSLEAWSHPFTYLIQFKIGNKFYQESIAEYSLVGNPEHPKTTWINLIMSPIKAHIKS
ncbi:hypothetical protein [Croceimicrobium hydrocarbonivorans]|uniref:Uncharacterized protein n=1 Tax=Croceimicrobium hydrocarbonivorans TaxID=2761580 RepID=A0A7H0VHL6_9FLAO|nr:hypothetical protein [Croceimicrobium hydrocarbonivorans]QNR25214.1 hypothetical protein H4K34_05065 [Croceimicrobium hydrocarbonivorans]